MHGRDENVRMAIYPFILSPNAAALMAAKLSPSLSLPAPLADFCHPRITGALEAILSPSNEYGEEGGSEQGRRGDRAAADDTCYGNPAI